MELRVEPQKLNIAGDFLLGWGGGSALQLFSWAITSEEA